MGDIFFRATISLPFKPFNCLVVHKWRPNLLKLSVAKPVLIFWGPTLAATVTIFGSDGNLNISHLRLLHGLERDKSEFIH